MRRPRTYFERPARPRVDVEGLKDRWPLDELAQLYGVRLHGRGTRRYARCPFHDDRSPSLVLYLHTRSWFCFGCRQWGDAIDWVGRMEGLEFLDACRFLGANLPREGPVRVRPSPKPEPFRDGLPPWAVEVLDAAAQIYHDALPGAPAACRYLRSRGVGAHAVQWAAVGYATGRDLKTGLEQRGIAAEHARQLGLLVGRGRELLRGRITVPVVVGGHVVTITGRAVAPPVQPRYLDLPLPPHALGLDLVAGQPRMAVVEGVFDFLVALEFRHATLSTMGTNVSDTVQSEIVAATRHLESIPLAFDDDDGGHQAVQDWQTILGPRAVPVQWPAGVADIGDLGPRPDGAARLRRMLALADATRTAA